MAYRGIYPRVGAGWAVAKEWGGCNHLRLKSQWIDIGL